MAVMRLLKGSHGDQALAEWTVGVLDEASQIAEAEFNRLRDEEKTYFFAIRPDGDEMIHDFDLNADEIIVAKQYVGG